MSYINEILSAFCYPDSLISLKRLQERDKPQMNSITLCVCVIDLLSSWRTPHLRPITVVRGPKLYEKRASTQSSQRDAKEEERVWGLMTGYKQEEM